LTGEESITNSSLKSDTLLHSELAYFAGIIVFLHRPWFRGPI